MTRTPSEGFGLEDDRDDLPFQIHHELDDAPMSVWAFRVYAHLVRRSGRDGKIFPSYQTIGETCFRSTYGPTANPKSLRNKAIAAMKELIEVGLVTKIERTRKASLQNDTNTYQLTPRRKWLGELKEKRTELVTETEETQKVMRVQRIENRAIRKLTQRQETERLRTEAESRQKATGEPEQTGAEPGTGTDLAQTEAAAELGGGGIPTVPYGTPTMPPHGIPGIPRGIPTVPEVISIEVLQSLEVISKEGGDFDSTENAREETQLESPTQPDEVTDAVEVTTTDGASLPTASVGETADGPSSEGTPDGVNDERVGLTEEEEEFLFGSQDVNVTAVEKVAPAATHDPNQTRAILAPKLGGVRNFDERTREVPPSRVDRNTWVIRITPARAQELIKAADAEFARRKAAGEKANAWTQLITLLDIEIGARIGQNSEAGGADKRVLNGATSSNNGQVSRAEPEADRPPQTVEQGSRWENKRNPEEIVTVVAFDGPKVELHNGKILSSLELYRFYHRVH
jgi:hypothetical protein